MKTPITLEQIDVLGDVADKAQEDYANRYGYHDEKNYCNYLPFVSARAIVAILKQLDIPIDKEVLNTYK